MIESKEKAFARACFIAGCRAAHGGWDKPDQPDDYTVRGWNEQFEREWAEMVRRGDG